MKAVLVQAANHEHPLLLTDVEAPRPGPNDLLVAVQASALNRADLRHSATHFRASESGPAHPVGGLEMTGIVVEVGSAVTGFVSVTG